MSTSLLEGEGKLESVAFSSNRSDEDGGAHTFPPQHRLQRGARNCLLILEPSFSAFKAFAVKELNKEQRGTLAGQCVPKGGGVSSCGSSCATCDLKEKYFPSLKDSLRA